MTLNFTVGPVQSYESTCEIGKEQVPYFRTTEFSNIILDNERMFLQFVRAPDGSKMIEITGSGTAAMESTVINLFSKEDKLLIVNGGTFGQRFVDICKVHHLNYVEIKIHIGKDLTKEDIEQYENSDFTGFLINMGETSTGVLYNMDLVSNFCKRNNLILVVDAISTFLADEIDMKKWGADSIITGSQKALACHPGLSIVALSPRALTRIDKNTCPCLYFDFKLALSNANRGQTPFTPAIVAIRQLNDRLRRIELAGGPESEIKRVRAIACDFRKKIIGLPLEYVSQSKSNAVTSLRPTNGSSAYGLFERIKTNDEIWVCPNGGDLKDIVFRVGHMGNLTVEDNDRLIKALRKELNCE